LVEALADGHEIALAGALTGLELAVLGAALFELGQLFFELFVAAVELDVALFFDGLALDHDLLFEVRQLFVALFDVDPRDQVGREVDDLFELLGLELFTGLGAHEEIGQPRTRAAEIPDVHDRCRELDVAHAVAPHLGSRDLDAAALADDALEAHALVLAAVALPVLGGTEDLLAEQAVLLGLERAVVDRLGLLHLAVRPHADLVRGGQTDTKLGKVVYIKHLSILFVPCLAATDGAAIVFVI
jgi:hypothetical protein